MSLIQAPSTPRRVEVARATPCLMASSKPVSETALSSVTLATDICSPLPWLAYCFPEHLLPAPTEYKRSVTGILRSESSPWTHAKVLFVSVGPKVLHIARRPNPDT